MLLDRLTTREKEILSMVSKGLGNEDIAERLVISDKTVEIMYPIFTRNLA